MVKMKRKVKIVNEGVKFDKKKYEGVFGDYDKDGVVNIDDANPTNKNKKGKVEPVPASKTFSDLLKLKEELDKVMEDSVDILKEKTPKDADIYARTKTPYSIIKKLVEKRLTHPEKGLQDLVGTTIAVDSYEDLIEVRNKIRKGTLGEVIEEEDMYSSPKDGYMAYHYIVKVGKIPVEVQLKTKRMKDVNSLTHEFYKSGTLNSKEMLSLVKLTAKADKGDKKAIAEYNSKMKDKSALKRSLDLSKMKLGGEVNSKADSLKKGDVITIKFGDSISKDNKVTLKVRSRNKVRKGTVDKITFENKNKPNTVRYYAYERGNGAWGFAKGDMAISNVKIVEKLAKRGSTDSVDYVVEKWVRGTESKKGKSAVKTWSYDRISEAFDKAVGDSAYEMNRWEKGEVVYDWYVKNGGQNLLEIIKGGSFVGNKNRKLFNESFRKHFSDSNRLIDDKEVYIVEIRVHNDEGDYSEEDYEFDTRKEAFDFANKEGNVHEIFYYPKGTDSDPKRLWLKGGQTYAEGGKISSKDNGGWGIDLEWWK